MKRPCWSESLAAKHQCLTKTLAAVKDAMTLCQAKITLYEEQNKAHDAEIQKTFEAEIHNQTTASSFNKIPWAGCNNTMNQSVIPKRHMKRPCRHCAGRMFVLTEAEGTTSPAIEIPTPVHDMQYTGHHDDVSQLWSVIRTTKTLREGLVVDSAVRGQWMYFPTCNMRPQSRIRWHFHRLSHGATRSPCLRPPKGTRIVWNLERRRHEEWLLSW